MKKRPLRLSLTLAITVALAACGTASVDAERASLVDDADVIFHVGCAERSTSSASLCEDERRVCGDVVDEAAAALGDGPIVVELVIDNVESASLLTWDIQPDGSGAVYEERGTDFPLECVFQACGLVKTAFGAGELVDDDGALVLKTGSAAAGIDADVSDRCAPQPSPQP
jgi:hypothetical protein